MSKTCPTLVFKVYIAGFASQIEQLCQKFSTDKKLCVFVSDGGKYIYNYGHEYGVSITIINYARFPRSYEKLEELALDLAHYLLDNTSQKSCSVVGPKESHWIAIKDYDRQ